MVKQVKGGFTMIFEVIQKTKLSIDSHGNVTVLSNTSTINPINVGLIHDSIVITQSQKDYNYLTLGKYSRIQLNRICLKLNYITK